MTKENFDLEKFAETIQTQLKNCYLTLKH